MKYSPLLQFESLCLHNRVGRPLDIELCCVASSQRYLLLLRANTSASAAQIDKSAECVAFQLRERLQVEGAQLTFMLMVADNTTTLQRWRLSWTGTSPVRVSTETIPASALNKFIDPQQSARLPLHLAAACA
jgi:hypothetical protein